MELSATNIFSCLLLQWYEEYGRKNLPWQKNITPYHVWISEIMLQQTQVATVISYYEKFIYRFPTIPSLANAQLDEVLSLWSGLGYYSRARNLHKTAQIIQEKYAGIFPTDFTNITSLPGIGRSTAGAILAISMQQNLPILDGNVKRVLTRFFAISGFPGEKKVENKLWEIATALMPNNQTAKYTQAIMDLGATICVRRKPLCHICPMRENCRAHLEHRQHDFPTPRPKKKIPIKITNMLLFINETGKIMLQKKPPYGVWGGLWCLPETQEKDIEIELKKYNYKIESIAVLKMFRHTFSHFHLDISPYIIYVSATDKMIMDSAQMDWYELSAALQLGLPAPIKKMIENVTMYNTLLGFDDSAQPTFNYKDNKMTRTIYCFKLKIETEGLDFPPYPGELGQKIYQTISKPAWQQWLSHQTMLINEYHLNLSDSNARNFLMQEMEKFLFGNGSEKPKEYVPPEK